MLSSEVAWSAAFNTVLVAVVISDCTQRRISNQLSLTSLVVGLAYWGVHAGFSGLMHALLGAALGGSLMLVLYIMRWVGGGDVKIMAALGASLGWQATLLTAVYGMAFGGLVALCLMVIQPQTISWKWLGSAVQPGQDPLARARAHGTTIPLAAALAAGVILARIEPL